MRPGCPWLCAIWELCTSLTCGYCHPMCSCLVLDDSAMPHERHAPVPSIQFTVLHTFLQVFGHLCIYLSIHLRVNHHQYPSINAATVRSPYTARFPSAKYNIAWGQLICFLTKEALVWFMLHFRVFFFLCVICSSSLKLPSWHVVSSTRGTCLNLCTILSGTISSKLRSRAEESWYLTPFLTCWGHNRLVRQMPIYSTATLSWPCIFCESSNIIAIMLSMRMTMPCKGSVMASSPDNSSSIMLVSCF